MGGGRWNAEARGETDLHVCKKVMVVVCTNMMLWYLFANYNIATQHRSQDDNPPQNTY
jgi:hypothetical protein